MVRSAPAALLVSRRADRRPERPKLAVMDAAHEAFAFAVGVASADEPARLVWRPRESRETNRRRVRSMGLQEEIDTRPEEPGGSSMFAPRTRKPRGCGAFPVRRRGLEPPRTTWSTRPSTSPDATRLVRGSSLWASWTSKWTERTHRVQRLLLRRCCFPQPAFSAIRLGLQFRNARFDSWVLRRAAAGTAGTNRPHDEERRGLFGPAATGEHRCSRSSEPLEQSAAPATSQPFRAVASRFGKPERTERTPRGARDDEPEASDGRIGQRPCRSSTVCSRHSWSP